MQSFQNILELTNEKTIPEIFGMHFKGNLQILLGLSPSIMKDIFKIRNNIYSLSISQSLLIYQQKTVEFGGKAITYKGLQIWYLIPGNIKNVIWNIFSQYSVLSGKLQEVNKKKLEQCPYRICKTYLQNTGFIQILAMSFFSFSVEFIKVGSFL